jgi:hypothetical protein
MWQPFTLLTVFTIDRTPPNLFSPCKKLRKVGFGIREVHSGTGVQKMLSSITSKHLSTVSFEIAHFDWCWCWHTWEEYYQWWGDLETILCQLADRCLANGMMPLVLEIVWWRQARHGGKCGIMHLDRIMPRFREKGLIRFMESNQSDCERCMEILGEGQRSPENANFLCRRKVAITR